MTHQQNYTVPTPGDAGQGLNLRSVVEHWIDFPRHILKCNGNELVLTRPPKSIDLMVIADLHYTPAIRPKAFDTSK